MVTYIASQTKQGSPAGGGIFNPVQAPVLVPYSAQAAAQNAATKQYAQNLEAQRQAGTNPSNVTFYSSNSTGQVQQLPSSTYNPSTDTIKPATPTTNITQPQTINNPTINSALNTLRAEQQRQNYLPMQNESRDLSMGIRQQSFIQSGRGTIVQTSKPYSNQEIINLGKSGAISTTGALNELANRESDANSRQANQYISNIAGNLYEQDKSKIQTYANQQAQLVQQGQIDVKEYNSRVAGQALTLDAQRNIAINKAIYDYQQSTGKQLTDKSNAYLKIVQDKLAVAHIGTRIASNLAVGAGAIALSTAVPVLAPVILYGGAAYTGYGLGIKARQVVNNPASLSKTDIALFATDIATMALGAKVGGRLVGGASVDIVKVQNAVNRADIRVLSPKSITEESRILTLEIPANEKARITNAMQQGYTIREIKADIVPANSLDKALIDKGLPNRNIHFVEVVNKDGDVVYRTYSFGSVEVTKGIKTYSQDVIARSEGLVNRQTGEFQTETITNVMQRKNPTAIDLILSAEKGKAQTSVNDIFRVTKGNVAVAEYGRGQVELPKLNDVIKKGQTIETALKDLSQKQFEELNRLSLNKPVVKSTGKFANYDKLVSKQGIIIKLGNERINILGVGKAEKYKGYGVAEYKPYRKPINFEKQFSKDIIGLEFAEVKVPEIKPLKVVELGKTEGNGILSSIPEPARSKAYGSVQAFETEISKKGYADFIDYLNAPSNVQLGTKQALSNIAGMSNVKTPTAIFAPTSQQTKVKSPESNFVNNVLGFDLMTKGKGKTTPNITNLNFENLLFKPQQRIYQGQASSVRQIEQQVLNTKQIEKQINQLQIQTPTIQLPKFPIPKVPDILGGFGNNQGAGNRNVKKPKIKLKKISSGYTASLAAAAFQAKPIKVTRKEYERLSKSTFSGLETRPVLEIIPDSKKIKKMIKSVSF